MGQFGGAGSWAGVGRGIDKLPDVEVAHVFRDIVPLVGRLAYHLAMRFAHGATLCFPENDEMAEQCADIARGIAHLHPAGG